MAYEVLTSRHTRLGAIDPYQKKINELHDVVKGKARELQSVTEEVDEGIREVKSLGEQKDRLITQIADFETQKGEEVETLSYLVTSQKQSLSSSVQELKREEKAVAAADGRKTALLSNINHLQKACRDFTIMVGRTGDVRKQYLISKERLDRVEMKSQKNTKDMNKRQKTLDFQQQILVDMDNHLSLTHKKLRNYLKIVRDNVKILNSMAKDKNLNLRFGLPLNEIVEISYEK